MESKIKLIAITKLKPHERINQQRFQQIKKSILKCGYLKKPIVVDKKTLTLLDGHHRVAIFKQKGLLKIPALLVNYGDKKVIVKSRRKKIFKDNDKNAVVKNANNGLLFPHKTTRHKIMNMVIKKCYFRVYP